MIACPTDADLGGYLDGALDDVAAARISRHLESCDDCRGRVDASQAELLGFVRRAFDRMELPTESDLDVAPGRYRILRRIGEGGMGVVYEAEQQRPKRSVALKVIRPEFASASALRRFEHEAEALGRLRHPGIAQIYEAATFEHHGVVRPFLAMELVDGASLSSWVESDAALTENRLDLFVAICDAVHHAHQKGVIHRDLKPANILVCDGRPKVLDFGVARITDGRVEPDQTVAGQIVGTLPYMSPEQVRGDPGALDIRVDVYALGVILYELLTRRLPLELEGEAIADAIERIAGEEPPALREHDRALQGDLEVVVSTALAKDRDRRYASARELGRDVERFLRHEPIAARPPSTWYHVRKFSRRHRAVVAGTLATFAVLVTGIVATSLQMFRAREAEAEALAAYAEIEGEALSARAAIDFLSEVLIQAAPGHATTNPDPAATRRTLEHAAALVDTELAEHPVVQAKVHHVLGDAFRDLGEPEIARDHLQQALDGYERLFGAAHRTVAEVLSSLALHSVRVARFDDAVRYAERALAMRDRVPANLATFVPECLQVLAEARMNQGDLDVGLEAVRQAVAEYQRIDPDSVGMARSLSTLGVMLGQRGEPDQAVAQLRRSLELKRGLLGATHAGVGSTLDSLAFVLKQNGDLDEAAKLQREALAIARDAYDEDHPAVARMAQSLGLILWERGEREAAEQAVRESLEVFERSARPDGPSVVHALNILGWMNVGLGRAQRAETALQRSVATASRTLPDTHILTIRGRAGLGELLADTERGSEAVPHLTHVLDHAPAGAFWAVDLLLRSRLALARVHVAAARFQAAETVLLAAWATAPAGSARVAVARALVGCYERWGKPERAAEYREAAKK